MDKNCWQTPQWILDGVDQVFGKGEWFDPFPPNYERCAMSYEWQKPAFCNPPYGRGKLMPLADYGVSQPVKQIWLTNLDCSTRWFKRLCANASRICLLHDRVGFINPSTGLPVGENNRSQVLFLIHGYEQINSFEKAFQHKGFVMEHCPSDIPF